MLAPSSILRKLEIPFGIITLSIFIYDANWKYQDTLLLINFTHYKLEGIRYPHNILDMVYPQEESYLKTIITWNCAIIKIYMYNS